LAEKHAAKAIALRMSEAERRLLRQKNLPDGFDIAEEDIYDFLRWRASSYSGLGETGEELAKSLTYQVSRFCAAGEAFAKSEMGQRIIGKIANEKRNVGNATWFYRQRSTKFTDIQHIPSPPASKIGLIKEIMAGFPNRILSESALDQIEAGLDKEGFPFDRRRDKDKLLGARRELGFEIDGAYWNRA
jgi:hypothetical protein